MAASQPLSGNRTHHGVEVVWIRKEDFSCGTFSASLKGRATEPVTIQLREPEVKMTMPSSQVKMLAPRLLLMRALLLIITSVNPSIPPDFSIR